MSYNDKLLKTTLSSIAHYNEEIEKLKQALAITESTKDDLVKSLLAVCPVCQGDVLMKPDYTTIKIRSILYAFFYQDGSIGFRVSYERHGQYSDWAGNDDNFTLKQLLEWKHVGVDETLITKPAV